MLVVACIKQVPDTTQVKIDPVTNTLVREGIPFIMNPFDTHALEEALRQSEAKYRELADLLPQMVFETDQDLNLTYANRQAITASGFTSQDLERGINALSLIDPSQHIMMRENVQKSLSRIPFEPVEYTALRKDGCQIPVIIYSAPVLRNDVLTGFRAVVVDISARKTADRGRPVGELGRQCLVELPGHEAREQPIEKRADARVGRRDDQGHVALYAADGVLGELGHGIRRAAE